jgi:hypothetical protein
MIPTAPYFITHLLVILFINECYSYPTRSYQLICDDGTDAIDRGLHACCPTYCVLCARFNPDYKSNCVTNCTGTVLRIEPFCRDCLCKRRDKLQELPSKEGEEESRHKKCPFMNKMK